MKMLMQIVVVVLSLLRHGKGAAKGLMFTTQSCVAVSKTPSYVEMVGKGGSWPQAGFCRTLVNKKVAGTSYSISVKLYNHEGFSGNRPGVGHPGVMYNAKDMNNFDFVYFRPHSTGGCFQTGYVQNGVIVTSGGLSSTCSNGPPALRTWFYVKVEIQGSSVRIYRDGQLVRTINSHFAPLGRGGVLVANGYRNTIRFKEFKVVKSPSYPHPTASCVAVSKTPSYVEMVGKGGSWPQAGFCRTLVNKKVAGTSYSISVKLYNHEGFSGNRPDVGHPGVMYNAKDMNNFDFVYFRPHSRGGCFQTGYVKNGVIVTSGGLSSTCPNGPPALRTWFQVKVEIQGSSVRIYRDGQLVRTITSHFAPLGRGGVLVANGYRNTIRFKEFKVVKSPSYPNPTASCVAVSKTPSYVEMVGKGGSWPQAGFCRTLVNKKVAGTSYSISVKLYNHEGFSGNRPGVGHPGVMYNAKDMNNFDFVYFRPHSRGGCFQTGYVKNGVIVTSGGLSSTCPNGPPALRTWFQVKVEIQGSSVRIYRDGQLVRTITSHFAPLGRGGVLVANGYRNTIRFKEFNVVKSPSYPNPTASCVAVSKTPSYVEMVGKGGSWPQAGFCRTLVNKKVAGTSYSISVKLYNHEGFSGNRPGVGHPGVMYNAKDMNNFDFVYFRPHSRGGCFQTGYVKNGVIVTSGGLSSTCPNGPPALRTWFQVKVEIQGSSVRIYKDGQLVRTTTSYFAPLGRGGVLVANGYMNTIRFKEFKVVKGPSYPHPTASCVAVFKTPSYVEMVGKGGSWPREGFCRTLVNKKVAGTSYSISVKLYNHEGFSGNRPGVGHPGVMYNAKDMNNFDFVYFRPHSRGGCFQTGYVQNGVIVTSGGLSSTCPNGPPALRTWFQVKVEIQGSSVRIYKDGQLVRTITSHFAPLGRGGVLVANGYRNTIRFKEFKVVKSPSYPHPTASCVAVFKTPSYDEMVGKGGSWPQAGFCRTLVNKKVAGTSYSISVKLYNHEGFSGNRPGVGHPGVMYNAKDMNNFDFVYFRPHSRGGCFQTGYVKNGVIVTSGGLSSTCPNGPPALRTWFRVKVEIQGSSVRIYRDGQLVRTITSHFAPLGRGGLLVANGYRNTIRFKEFKVVKGPSHPHPTASCVAVFKTPSYVEMVGKGGSWPREGFCRTLVNKKVAGTSYSISVKLYNHEGFSGNRPGVGHPGVMYNAKDMNNFDFVYFRPHSRGGCFQTGYVKNGVIVTSGGLSSTCSNGPPATKTWFQVKVEIQGSSVRINRDGQLVRTITSHFAPLGRGGVLVANGYRNTIRFKDFKIR